MTDKYNKCVKDCGDDFECKKKCERYKKILSEYSGEFSEYSGEFYKLHPEHVYRDSNKKYKKCKFDGKIYD
jgi:hypothetical protein